MEILRSYADVRENGDALEQISIDEAFLEITEKTGGDFSLAFELGIIFMQPSRSGKIRNSEEKP